MKRFLFRSPSQLPDLREALATYSRTEDLIHLGAYAAGANLKPDERASFDTPLARMKELTHR